MFYLNEANLVPSAEAVVPKWLFTKFFVCLFVFCYKLKYSKNKLPHRRKITKRSFKNFNKTSWNQSIASKYWSGIESTDLDNMVEIFTKNVNEALDYIAPYKTFTVRSQFKFGLTDETNTK